MDEKLVKVINKAYGKYKNEIISLGENDYKSFITKFIRSGKTIEEHVQISSIIAVMNGWRME